MAEEIKQEARQEAAERERVRLIYGQPAGKYVLAAGVAGLFSGFILLGYGSMNAAPVLIIGSLVVIGLGLWKM